MAFTVTPAMIAASFDILIYEAVNDFTRDLRDDRNAIKQLELSTYEELMGLYFDLIDKTPVVYDFINNQPLYDTCEDNGWHGAIDGKIAASNAITKSMNTLSKYQTSKKLKVLNIGLSEMVGIGASQYTVGVKYEYVLEDLYYENLFTGMAQSAAGSPSPLIDDGFKNATAILSGIESYYDDIRGGSLATLGVLAGSIISDRQDAAFESQFSDETRDKTLSTSEFLISDRLDSFIRQEI